MTKYKQSFEKCVIKIQRTQDAYKFWREITEITSSINSRVRLWKINHSGPGCSFLWMLRVVYFPVKHSCLYNKRQYLIFIFLSFSGSTREEFGRGIPLWARLDFPGGTPYNCLYGEAPPERGAFFTRQVYKRVGISLVSSQAIKRVGPRGGASQYKTLLSPPVLNYQPLFEKCESGRNGA